MEKTHMILAVPSMVKQLVMQQYVPAGSVFPLTFLQNRANVILLPPVRSRVNEGSRRNAV